MLGLRLIPGLLSFLVTAGSSVGLYLDSAFIGVNDIFPKRVFILDCLYQSLFLVHLPDHLAIVGAFRSPAQLLSPPQGCACADGDATFGE